MLTKEKIEKVSQYTGHPFDSIKTRYYKGKIDLDDPYTYPPKKRNVEFNAENYELVNQANQIINIIRMKNDYESHAATMVRLFPDSYLTQIEYIIETTSDKEKVKNVRTGDKRIKEETALIYYGKVKEELLKRKDDTQS